MPATRSVAGKAAGAVIGSVLGASTRSWWGMLLLVGGGVLAGHAVDHLMQPICGHCELRRG